MKKILSVRMLSVTLLTLTLLSSSGCKSMGENFANGENFASQSGRFGSGDEDSPDVHADPNFVGFTRQAAQVIPSGEPEWLDEVENGNNTNKRVASDFDSMPAPKLDETSAPKFQSMTGR